MHTLRNEYITILRSFASLFSQRIWKHAKILLIGSVLSPAERTVTAALRVMGLSLEKHFANYHRVLYRAKWSSLEASHILLGLLVNTFAPRGPILMGLDDTIERRRGAMIEAKGIYRDPVRSSHGHGAKAPPVDCVGSRSCCWRPSPGRVAPGHCLSLRCWRLRSVITKGNRASTRNSRSGLCR